MNTTAHHARPTITDLIREDHAQVADIFRQYQAGDPSETKQKLVNTVSLALETQALLKEEIFLPALRPFAADDASLAKSEAARHQMQSLIGQLRDMRPTATRYDDTVTTLMSVFTRHMADEEAVLLQAEHLMPAQLTTLGARMRMRRLVLNRPRIGQWGPMLVAAGGLVAAGYLIKRALARRAQA